MSENKCEDKNCPVHGSLKCRGRTFTGTILSTKMHRTAIIEWNRQAFIPKYERYEKKRTKIKVHNPDCIGAKEGEIVTVTECRPLSKTKHFVITKKVGTEKGFKERMEAEDSAKFIEKDKKIKEDVEEDSEGKEE